MEEEAVSMLHVPRLYFERAGTHATWRSARDRSSPGLLDHLVDYREADSVQPSDVPRAPLPGYQSRVRWEAQDAGDYGHHAVMINGESEEDWEGSDAEADCAPGQHSGGGQDWGSALEERSPPDVGRITRSMSRAPVARGARPIPAGRLPLREVASSARVP